MRFPAASRHWRCFLSLALTTVKQGTSRTQSLNILFFLAHTPENQMQTGKPFDHRRMHRRVRHGGFTVPFGVHIIPIRFWRIRGLDIAGIVHKANDGTAVIRTIKFMMILLIEIRCRGSLIPEKHSLLAHNIHGIDAGEKYIPADLSRAKLVHRPVHYRGGGGAPIGSLHSRIFALETTLDTLHDVTLNRTENRYLAFLFRCFDEVFILPADLSHN